MIYPVETPIEVGTIPDVNPVLVLHAMDGEARFVQIISVDRPVLATTEQLGLLMELQPLGLTRLTHFEPVPDNPIPQPAGESHWYDVVDSPEGTQCWLLKLLGPGPGPYNFTVTVKPPNSTDPDFTDTYEMTLMVSRMKMPDLPSLQSRFGTHFSNPVNDGTDAQQKSYDWFVNHPAFEYDQQAGENERDGYARVYQSVNDDMAAARCCPYMAQFFLWPAGYGIVQTGQDFYDCSTKTYDLPDIAKGEIAKFGGRSFGQTMGQYHFQRQPGVWALCGMRQDRIIVAAGDRIPDTDPAEYYTAEQAAAVTAENMEAWNGHLTDFYTALKAFADENGYDMHSFADEPFAGIGDEGNPYAWQEDGIERLKWSMDAAFSVGYRYMPALWGEPAFDDCMTYDLQSLAWMFHHDGIDDDWLTQAHLDQLQNPAEIWGYITRTDSMFINLVDGHRNHPGTGEGTADKVAIEYWKKGFKGILHWSWIQPNTEWFQNLDNHLCYIGGYWSIRLFRWQQAMVLHDWLVAVAEFLGEDGKLLLEGYIEGLDGEALRAMLFDLAENFETAPNYHMQSVSSDRVGEIRVDWSITPSGSYLLWRTLNTDLTLDPEQVPGWMDEIPVFDDAYYIDQDVTPDMPVRYRVDYWDDDQGKWIRMLPDMVGVALSDPVSFEDGLRAVVADVMASPYALQLWHESAIQRAMTAAGMVPNHNESGDGDRVPIFDWTDPDGNIVRYQRGQNMETGDAAIFYCINENWSEVFHIPDNTPTQDDE